MTYLKEPAFWVAVIAVAVIINFVWNMATGKGKLV
jgi:hypothetical protein